MEEKDLNSFRDEWLSELKAKKIISPKYFEGNKTNGNCSNTYDGTKFVQNGDKSKRGESINAFDIANVYLNFNPRDCMYCHLKKNDRPKETGVACRRCKCGSSEEKIVEKSKKRKSMKINKSIYVKRHFGTKLDFKETSSGDGKENANLVDLLIADINEITCIPFFDIDLPKEIAIKIFQYLSIKDLANCCCVNSKWRTLALDDLIWFNLCEMLDVERGVQYIAERQGWYQYVKGCMVERRRIQSRWRERCCEVRDLEKAEDFVLCSASVHSNYILAAYLDGSIKLWDLYTGSCGTNLKEKFSNIEDIVLSVCSSVYLNQHLCIAGFENGDVMVWKRDSDLCGELIFMDNYTSKPILFIHGSMDGKHFLVGFESTFILVGTSDIISRKWDWTRICEVNVGDKISALIVTNTALSPPTIINTTNIKLNVYVTNRNENVTLEQLAGATISCVDYKNSFVVAGIGGFGYSILDGYRIRKYCMKTGKQVGNIIGSQNVIICLNYADCCDDQVVVGCADCSIRIHDFKNESLLMKINGIDSTITTIQMDKWKVVTGHKNGTLSLWDRFNGCMCWQSRVTKHPVRICKFDGQLLTAVSIPEDIFKERIYFSDEMPSQHRCKGSIRVMDFTKDNDTIGVPDVCHAEYDNITGYDYNIELIAPYDDVDSLLLPKI